MAKITKEQVEHIAELARLGISEQEKSEFADQFSEILSYVEQLKEVDAEKVEPAVHLTGLTNVTREDEPGKQILKRSSKKELLKNAPQIKDDYFKVPIIIDQG